MKQFVRMACVCSLFVLGISVLAAEVQGQECKGKLETMGRHCQKSMGMAEVGMHGKCKKLNAACGMKAKNCETACDMKSGKCDMKGADCKGGKCDMTGADCKGGKCDMTGADCKTACKKTGADCKTACKKTDADCKTACEKTGTDCKTACNKTDANCKGGKCDMTGADCKTACKKTDANCKSGKCDMKGADCKTACKKTGADCKTTCKKTGTDCKTACEEKGADCGAACEKKGKTCSVKARPAHCPMGRWVCDLASLSGVKNADRKPSKAIELTLSKGKVHGFSGVNRFFGSVSLKKDGSIAFENMGSTRMMGRAIGYEDAFMQALAKVKFFQVHCGRLLLKDADKNVLLQFNR